MKEGDQAKDNDLTDKIQTPEGKISNSCEVRHVTKRTPREAVGLEGWALHHPGKPALSPDQIIATNNRHSRRRASFHLHNCRGFAFLIIALLVPTWTCIGFFCIHLYKLLISIGCIRLKEPGGNDLR
jgi:hypothetical protein